jgi:hypothetical protein
MINTKFRDHVRMPVAMVNEMMIKEVSCKLICHNICVLIQAMHEFGIDADFQKRRRFSEETSAALPGKLLELAAFVQKSVLHKKWSQ